MDMKIGTIMAGNKAKIITVLVLLLFAIVLSSCAQSQSTTDESVYERYLKDVRGAEAQMPSVQELGDYVSIYATQQTTPQFLFSKTDSVALIVQYAKEDYINAKQAINESYTFVDQASKELGDYKASVAGYNIRVVKKDEVWNDAQMICYDYPSCFLMIGHNDAEYKIIYMYHYDFELDNIDNLDKYIKQCYLIEE